MEFTATDHVPFPRDLVYVTMRDKMPDLVPYLPDIRSITVEKREESGPGRVKLLNRWMAEDRIPTLAKKFISADQIGWLDHAEWVEAEHLVNYRLEMLFFREYVDVRGTNRFVGTSDGGTEVRLSGTLHLDIAKHPAVPRLLAGKVRDMVEQIVMTLIKPNLTKVNRGIEQHLAAAGHKPVR